MGNSSPMSAKNKTCTREAPAGPELCWYLTADIDNTFPMTESPIQIKKEDEPLLLALITMLDMVFSPVAKD